MDINRILTTNSTYENRMTIKRPETVDSGMVYPSVDQSKAPLGNDDFLAIEPVISKEPAKSRPGFGLEDVSLTFNKTDSFDYIGKDKDVADLDVQKAISDMQKDRIFQQYQYFVGGL